jgi:nitroreductase
MSERKVKKIMLIIFLSIGTLLILAFVSLLLISGIFQSQKYLEPWQKTYSQKFEDPRIRLVSHGLLAANGHNMQPWKVRLNKNDPKVFYLYADSDRLTNQVDPLSRQMMITQGTFLEYVKVAGDELGYETSIDLFPEGDYNEQKLSESMKTKPVAKITITRSKPHNNPLYDSIFLPDTNREAYQEAQLTSDQVNQLEAINTDTNISIKIYQDKKNLNKLAGYAMNGANIEAGVSRVMEESRVIFRSNEYEKNKYRYGFSVEGQGTSGVMVHLMQGMVTLFPSMNSGKTASDMFIQSTKKSVDNTPAYAMIITKDNSRESQVRSGMLYSRFILEAHRLGLAMQPLSQVLEEYSEMKEPYNSIHNEYASDGAAIQMLVRLGKPTKDVPLSMRRDVMDLIVGE